MAADAQYPVKQAQSFEELRAVGELRYHVYVEELKRDNYAYIDDIEKILVDGLDHKDSCKNLFVSSEDDTVGVCRISVPFPVDQYAGYFSVEDPTVFPGFSDDMNNFSFLTRFMVRRDFRRTGVANSLLRESYHASRRAGAKFIILNCSPCLVAMYEKKGFLRYRDCFVHPTMGLQVPMLLVCDALPFLTSVAPASPFLAAARSFHRDCCQADDPAAPAAAATGTADAAAATAAGAGTVDAASVAWLQSLQQQRGQGGQAAVLLHAASCDEGATLRYIAQCGGGVDPASLQLFQGLSSEELAQFLGKAVIVGAASGSLLSRPDEVRDEAYLLLQGAISVDGVETAGPGFIVGEASFLSGRKRASTVRATQPVLLLVISRFSFQKAMANVPHIAVKVLWNMSQMLARQFSDRMALIRRLLPHTALQPLPPPPKAVAIPSVPAPGSTGAPAAEQELTATVTTTATAGTTAVATAGEPCAPAAGEGKAAGDGSAGAGGGDDGSASGEEEGEGRGESPPPLLGPALMRHLTSTEGSGCAAILPATAASSQEGSPGTQQQARRSATAQAMWRRVQARVTRDRLLARAVQSWQQVADASPPGARPQQSKQ